MGFERRRYPMLNILVLTSHGPREASRSQSLADLAIHHLSARFPGAGMAVCDLAESAPPRANGFFADDPVLGGRKRGTSVDVTSAQSDDLIDELLAADILAIAIRMIDFAIPPPLKAWIDHVTRRGRTFQYTDGLPKGLVTGTKAMIICHHGGRSPSGSDYQAPYLRQMLGFLGVTDIEVIDLDGMSAAEPGESTSHRGIVWMRGAGRVVATVSERHHFSSLERTSLGAPAARSTRLKAPWR